MGDQNMVDSAKKGTFENMNDMYGMSFTFDDNISNKMDYPNETQSQPSLNALSDKGFFNSDVALDCLLEHPSTDNSESQGSYQDDSIKNMNHQQQQVIQYQRAQAKKLQIEQEIQALCDQNGGVPPDSSPLQGLLGNQLRPQPPLDFLGMSENRAPQSQNTGSRKSPTEAELAAFRYQIQNPQPSQQAQFMQPPYQPAGGSVFRQHMPPSLVPQRINTAERNGVGGVYGRHPHISPSSSSSGFGTPSFGGGSGSYKASPASFSGHLPSPLASGNALHLPQQQIPASPLSNFSGAVYQVQFKQAFRDYILGPRAPATVAVGDFVIVECDRGEDLGVVTAVSRMSDFVERRYLSKVSLEDEASDVGRIVRLATLFERQQLPEKFHDEQNVVQVTAQLSSCTFKLPMRVLDAEYQYDRKKLTVYYASDIRIDFRELVRDLFSAYRTRIWMKKVNLNHPFAPVEFAVLSLSSGVHFGSSKAAV